jgi:DNA-binding CsgD family transcriptional regulator
MKKEKSLIENYIAKGKTPKEIAEILGIDVNHFYYVCKRYGLTWKNHCRKKEKILIENYIAQGKTPKEIIDILGMGFTAFYVHCKKYGLTWKKYARPNMEKEKILMEMYIAQGKSPKEIADILGIGVGLFYYRCKRYGFARKKRIRPLSDRDSAILQMRRDGLTLADIAARFGITRERVRQIEMYNKTAREPLGEQYNHKTKMYKGIAERRDAARKMRLTGASYNEIAECLGIPVSNVVSDLRKDVGNAIPKYARSPDSIKKYEAIVQDYLNGEALKDISAKYGMSIGGISYVLRKSGTPLRRAPNQTKK